MWPGYAGRKRNAEPPGVPSRPSPQVEPLPVPEGAQERNPAPAGNSSLRNLRVREFWPIPRSRENTRAARRTLMRVDRTPPAGPFAKTDDATLRALSQSLEGKLREEILKELDLRAGRRAE